MDDLIAPLGAIDWNDIDAVEQSTYKVLSGLAKDRTLIRSRLLELSKRPELMELCEHYDILDKIVLYSDEAGVRLRLHIFLPGYFDRPHNHRWSYASRILRGDYRHHLYGDAEIDESADPAVLTPLQVRHEQPGSSYALHHSMVHAVVADPFTVSLIMRGPAVKDRFLVMDRTTGESWWQYGAKDEDPTTAANKRMAPNRLDMLTRQLRDWDVF